MVDKSGLRYNLAGRTRASSPGYGIENPMLNLWYQYHAPFIDDYSLSDIVLGLSELVLTESRDTVTNLGCSTLSLHPLLLAEVEEVLDIFQHLLDQVASLFSRPNLDIYPYPTIRSLLRCADTFEDVQIAWDIFVRRILAADTWFERRLLPFTYPMEEPEKLCNLQSFEPPHNTGSLTSRVTAGGFNTLTDCLGVSSCRQASHVTDCLACEAPEIDDGSPISRTFAQITRGIALPPQITPNEPSSLPGALTLPDVSQPILTLQDRTRLSCSQGLEGQDLAGDCEGDHPHESRLVEPHSSGNGPSELGTDINISLSLSAEYTRVISADGQVCTDNRLTPIRGCAEPSTDNRLGEAPSIEDVQARCTKNLSDRLHSREHRLSSFRSPPLLDPGPPPSSCQMPQRPDFSSLLSPACHSFEAFNVFPVDQLAVHTASILSKAHSANTRITDPTISVFRHANDFFDSLLITEDNAGAVGTNAGGKENGDAVSHMNLQNGFEPTSSCWAFDFEASSSPPLLDPGPSLSPLPILSFAVSLYRPNPSSRNGPSGYLVDFSRTLSVLSSFARAQELAKSACTDKRETREALDGLCDDGDGYTVSKLQFCGLVVVECRVGFATWRLRASRLISTLHRLLVPSSSPSHPSPNSPLSTLLYLNSWNSPATRAILGSLTTIGINDVSKSPETSTMVIRARDLIAGHPLPLLVPGPSDTARPTFTFAESSYRCCTISRNAPSYNLVHVLRTRNFDERVLTADGKGVVHKILNGLHNGGDGHAVSKVRFRGFLIDERRPSLAHCGLQVSRFTIILLRLSVSNSSSSSHLFVALSLPIWSAAQNTSLVDVVDIGGVSASTVTSPSIIRGILDPDCGSGKSVHRVTRSAGIYDGDGLTASELLFCRLLVVERYIGSAQGFRSPSLNPRPSPSNSGSITSLRRPSLLQPGPSLVPLLIPSFAVPAYQPDLSPRNGPFGYLVDVSQTLIVLSSFARAQEQANSPCTDDFGVADPVKVGKGEKYEELRELCYGVGGLLMSEILYRGLIFESPLFLSPHHPSILDPGPSLFHLSTLRASRGEETSRTAQSAVDQSSRCLVCGACARKSKGQLGKGRISIVESRIASIPSWVRIYLKKSSSSTVIPPLLSPPISGLSSANLRGLPIFSYARVMTTQAHPSLPYFDESRDSPLSGRAEENQLANGLCNDGSLDFWDRVRQPEHRLSSTRLPPLLRPRPSSFVYPLALRLCNPVPLHSSRLWLDISFTSQTSWSLRTSGVPTPMIDLGVLGSLATSSPVMEARNHAPFPRAEVNSDPLFNLEPNSHSPSDTVASFSTSLITSINVVDFLRAVDTLFSVVRLRIWDRALATCLHDLRKIHRLKYGIYENWESKGMYGAGDGSRVIYVTLKLLMDGIWALPPNQLSIYAVLPRVGGATTSLSHFTPLTVEFSELFCWGARGYRYITPFMGRRTIL